MVPRARKIIAEATRLIGLEEEPRGSNDGPNLRKALADTHFKPGDRWCMYFCVHCLHKGFEGAGSIPAWLPETGSCQAAAIAAHSWDKLSEFPATGSIFVLPNEEGVFHHAGIVTEVDEELGVIKTIEGNTNLNGSANGYGVFRRTRKINKQKYIIW